MNDRIPEVLGWLGTFLILTAYFLGTFEILATNTPSYALLNLLGAFFLGIDLFRKKATAALTLQIVWGAIAIMSLVKLLWN